MKLSNKQIRFLRKTAHHEKPLFQMGKQGLTEAFIVQVDQALERRELVKFNLLQNTPESVDDVALKIAEAIDAVVVQVIGHTAILYRPSRTTKYQRLSQEVNQVK